MVEKEVKDEAKRFFGRLQQKVRGEIIFATIAGSHLYGTSLQGSDIDVRGVFIPPLGEVLLGDYPPAYSEGSGKFDATLWSLQHFRNLLLKGDTNAVEIVFADTNDDCVLLVTPMWDKVKVAARKLITRPLRGFLGYAISHANRYGIKTVTYRALELIHSVLSAKDSKSRLEDCVDDIISHLPPELASVVNLTVDGRGQPILVVGNHKYYLHAYIGDVVRSLEKQINARGERVKSLAATQGDIDYKALSHAIRCLYEGIELHETGQLRFPLDRALTIVEVKCGVYGKSAVLALFQSLLDKFFALEHSGSVLPEQRDDTFGEILIQWALQSLVETKK